jgi:hypothetical protein
MISSQTSSRQKDIVGKMALGADDKGTGLTKQMLALLEKADGKDIELGTALSTMSGRNNAVLIVFLSFPLCIPVGIPVLSTTLSLMLGLVGFFSAIGREIWIPKSISAKNIPFSRLSPVIKRFLRISVHIERWVYPRMPLFVTNSAAIRIHGAFIMLLGLVAAIPLPLPFNNLVAAFPALLLGISLLEKDGLLAIISYLSSIPFFLYYAALVFLGYAGFSRLMGL